MSLDAFRKHLAGAAGPEPDGDEAAAGPDQSSDGMSPGEQAMAAIKSGDATALEEAIRRCIDKQSY